MTMYCRVRAQVGRRVRCPAAGSGAEGWKGTCAAADRLGVTIARRGVALFGTYGELCLAGRVGCRLAQAIWRGDAFERCSRRIGLQVAGGPRRDCAQIANLRAKNAISPQSSSGEGKEGPHRTL